VLDDETSATNGAQQPEQPEANTPTHGFVEQQKSSPAEQEPGNEEPSSNNSPKPIFPIRMWRQFTNWWTDPYRRRGNFPEHLTVVVSVVIAVIAFFQWGVYRQQKRIMEGAGAQTQKLIDAANIQACAAQKIADASDRNADAAESFSKSAEAINNQTGLAVDKFDRIAKASEESIRATQKAAKDALDASVEASRTDQRAWVSVDVKIAVNSQPRGFEITFMNTGKTPALDISTPSHYFSAYVPATKERLMKQPEPSLIPVPPNASPLLKQYVEEHNAEVTKLAATKTGGYVLAPNASRSSTMSEFMGVYMGSDPANTQREHNFIQGYITYKDIFGKSRETWFCYWQPSPNTLKLCDNGNGMN
jgi:hypothetical protein